MDEVVVRSVCRARLTKSRSVDRPPPAPNAKSPRERDALAGFLTNPGDFLLSHAVSRAVPSAPAGLTSVFGMGTGVTLPTKSPENFSKIESLVLGLLSLNFSRELNQSTQEN